MAINTTLSGLSQNPALNGPSGSDPVSSGDDALRYALSFTAQLRDGVGFTPGAIPYSAMAYTAVHQGGGTAQGGDNIYIGWNNAAGRLYLQIESGNYGEFWPISITGTAANATLFSGNALSKFLTSVTADNIVANWNGSSISFGVNGNFYGGVVPMSISGNAATATTATNATNASNATTANNANNLGGVAAANFVQYGPSGSVVVAGPRLTGASGRAIPNTDNRVNYFYITGPDLAVEIDGTPYAISKSAVSDERLKTNIKATEADSLDDIGRLEFKQFDFTGEAVLFAPGTHRDVGVTAQQAQTVRADWVKEVQGYKHMNEETLLMSALHAIQQLKRRIDALEAK